MNDTMTSNKSKNYDLRLNCASQTLIADAIMQLLWSALAVEEFSSQWSVRLHIICHTSRKTNHFYSVALFSQDAECNANFQSRHTGENRSGIAFTTNLSLSTSISLALLLSSRCLLRSVLLFTYLSLCHSFTFFSLSSSLFSSVSLSHTLTHSIILTSYLSLSLSFTLSSSLAHTRTPTPHKAIKATRRQP